MIILAICIGKIFTFHNFNRVLIVTAASLLPPPNPAFIGILFLLPIAFSGAQTTQELNDKINQKNVDISKLEQEIAQYQSEIDDLGKQKDSLNKTITQLDLSRKKLTANISVTQNNIDKTINNKTRFNKSNFKLVNKINNRYAITIKKG